MGVYIPDMEMPKNCINCPLLGSLFNCRLADDDEFDNLNERRDDCPLIEVVEWHNCIVDKEAE